MPIRFRCPTCTGLMSIARRKANAVVTCPKCGERVIVPVEQAVAVASNGASDRPLFERPDFDQLLERAGVPVPPPPPEKPEPTPVAEVLPEPAAIELSYPAAFGLAAGAAGLVLLAFAAGYLLK